MSELNNKKYLDLVGLKKYDELIKNLIATGNKDLADAIAALEAKIGEIDVEGSIAEIVSALEAKDVELVAKDAEIEGKVTENTTNIGSVSSRVDTLEATIDDLKNLGGENGLVNVVDKVNANVTAISILNGEGEGSVKKAAADAAAQALADANAYADGLAANYDAAGAAAAAKEAAIADAAEKYQVKGDYEVAGTAAGLNAAMDTRMTDVEGDVAALKAIDHEQLVADAVAAVVAGAESDFDTLKEVAEWIAADTLGSAALQTTVSEHTTSITTLTGDLTELEEKVDEDIANLTTHMTEASAALTEVDGRLAALEAFEETHASIENADIEALFAPQE